MRLDGEYALKDADPAAVRARLALVAQDAPLFSGSALDNLRFGDEAASEEALKAAARPPPRPAASSTPCRKATKPRSANAPAPSPAASASASPSPAPWCAARRSLLLDEATCALDAENERLVQRALADAMQGRTTLVIAHRLATVLAADRIVVMDEGRVVEQGTHAELIARAGRYARLAKLQFDLRAA